MRWEWPHPQQGTQLGTRGWLLCPTAASGALGTGLGRGRTLLSLCLAVTVPRALPWGMVGSFGPSTLTPSPWPQLQVSPGWLCWVTPPGRSQEHPRQPQLSPGRVWLWGHPWARVVTEVAEQWCLCPEQLLRDSRFEPQSEAAQGCVMHLSEVKDPCWHCRVPLCNVTGREGTAGCVLYTCSCLGSPPDFV